MSRCDCEGVFYRVFCVSLLVIAFTFTVILTNVFIDIDNLLNRKEKGVENIGIPDHVTDAYKATTEIQDYYIGVETDDKNYRNKRSLDSEQILLRINNPKTKRYLTHRLAALLEALDDDEAENTTPKDNGNIYIKTVKQKNNIEINELPPENGHEQLKVDEDIMHLALHNMLQGSMGRVDMIELLKKIQSLVSSLKNGASKRESKNAGSVEEFTETTTESTNLSEEQIPTERLLKVIGKKRDATLDFYDGTNTKNAIRKMRNKKSHGKNEKTNPMIRTLIDIKKDETTNSKENLQGIIKLIYNGKPVIIRSEDSHESTTTIATTTTSEKPQRITNPMNKDVEELAGVLRDTFKKKHMADTYLTTVMLEYLKNLAKSNNSSTATTIAEKKKTRIKRNLDWSNETQTEIPQTKDDDELFVEIETHFDKTGLKGEKKRKLVTSLINKIQNAIRSSPEVKDHGGPIMKRVQNPYGHRTAPDHTDPPVSQSFRDQDPIGKSMPIVEPFPFIADRNGGNWKKAHQEPKFLSASKSINSAELNLVAVDYNNQDPKYPVIPQRQQLPLTVDTSGENVNTLDVGKLQLLIKDIEGTGFSIGYNQYVDQAPDPESIKLFHGIEHIVDKYHQKHDKPDQPPDHEGEYEMYGQELRKREIKSESSLRTKRFVVNRDNDLSFTISKSKIKPLVIKAHRKKRSVNLKTIINSNKKIQVSKYINTNAFSRQKRYFKGLKRLKRQIDNIKVIDKTGQVSEDNNMFVVSGGIYNDNLMVRHRQKPDDVFVDVVKSSRDHFLNHKPFFQPSNKPFSTRAFEIKNLNIYKNTPMFFETKRKDFVRIQGKRERNKRHTIKIFTRDMARRDPNERSYTEYDEDNENAYADADRAVITQLDGPQISNSDEEERQIEFGHTRMNSIPVIYKNPFIVEDQNEFRLDPIRNQMIKNPLMSKYPHVFVDETTSGERAEEKHKHRSRSMYSVPESKETEKSSEIEGLYQAPSVQNLVNAIVPSYRNNYKISVKLIPHNGDNDTKQNFKEVHTSINNTFNKDGLLYSSLVNVSEISKIENYTNPCNNLMSTTPQNRADSFKPVLVTDGLENTFMASKLAEYDTEINDITRRKQGPGESSTVASMQMNLMDIILPSSPRRVIHFTVADVGKLICDSMKLQNTTNSITLPQTLPTRKNSKKLETQTTTTSTTTTTTAMPTEAVATTQPGIRIVRENTKPVDPLKVKLLKAISLNEQLTSQILDRIDQNTGVLQTFLSKIASEIANIPNIAKQAIKNKEIRFKKQSNQNEYPDTSKAHTINVTKIAPPVYPIPQKPTPKIKPATVLNQNFIQMPLKNNQRINSRDVQKRINTNNSDELKQMEQMRYFIDYDPKTSVPQSIANNVPNRLVLGELVDDRISKLNADHISNPSQLNNMHMIPAINNAIIHNNGTHYLR